MIQTRCLGIGRQQRELRPRERAFEQAEHFLRRLHGRLTKRLHARGGIHHESNALHSIAFQPTRLHQQPGEQQHHEQLQPERDGGAQTLEAVARAALAPHLLQQKQRGGRHTTIAALEKMNRHHSGQTEQRPQTPGVGESEAHALSTPPLAMPSCCSAF